MVITVSEFSIISVFVGPVSHAPSISVGWLFDHLQLDQALSVSLVLFDLSKLWLWALAIVESL